MDLKVHAATTSARLAAVARLGLSQATCRVPSATTWPFRSLREKPYIDIG
jgi:hypothetical protein